MSDTPLPNRLTLEDVARELSVSTMTARRLVKAGDISAVLWHGRFLVTREDLALYIRKAVKVYRAEMRPTRAAASA